MLDLGTIRLGVSADTMAAKKGLRDIQTEVAKTEQAGTQGTNGFKAAFQNLAPKIAQTAKVAATAVGAAVGTMGVAATKSYADFEQLKGGVEKLYGDSAQTLMNYADEAYKTAGLSANQYMEQATKFSASMIRGCGGDTKKAVELTNQAIADMSDNVNTFGTDMQAVQNAYQGFAKNNYTMLENLRLGYAGSKEGMEQLLQDAEQLSNRKFELGNFADMTEAIRVVQQNMKITGTTVKEARQTISGSFNMMKASWDNFLTSLGTGNTEKIKQNMDILVKNAGTFLSNAAPVFLTAITSLISILAAELPGKVSEFMNNLPEIINGAWETVCSTIRLALPADSVAGFDTIKTSIETFVSTVSPYIESVSNIIGTVLVGAFNLAKTAIAALQPAFDAIVSLLQTLSPIFTAVASVVQDVFAQAFEIAKSVIEPAFTAISGVVQTVVGVIQTIIGTFVGIFTGDWQQAADGASGIVEGMKNTIGGIFGAIANLLSGIFNTILSTLGGWISGMVEGAIKAGSDFLTNIITFFTQLPGNILNLLTRVIQCAIDFAKNLGKQGLDAGKKFLDDLVNGIKEAPGKMLEMGKQIIDGLVNGIQEAPGKIISAITGVVDGAISKAKELLGIHSPSRVFREIGDYTMQGFELGITKRMGSVVRTMKDASTAAVDAFDAEFNPNLMGDYEAFKTNRTLTIAAQGAVGNNTTNLTINQYSPKALSEKETAREFKATMRDLALSR